MTTTEAVMRAAVLVPVKAFRHAKARLAGVLDPADRERLARWTAERVVVAAAPLPVHVVCDDREVAGWAEECGATVIWRPGVGLNAAVDHGLAALRSAGITHAVVAHSDLPLACDLGALAHANSAVLVPDARLDGTNVLAIPLHHPFRAAYGSGSFERHRARLRAAGVSVAVRADPLLALDIDTIDDLRHPSLQEVLPEWLRTSLANHV